MSARSGGNAWVGYVHERGHPGEIEYEFLLEPQYDVRGLLMGWDLDLFPPERRNRNLLEPAGNWHGLQPFNFVARDFLAGADHSVFGATRTIRVRGTKSEVFIRVVRAVAASADEFSSLELHVEFRDPGGA